MDYSNLIRFQDFVTSSDNPRHEIPGLRLYTKDVLVLARTGMQLLLTKVKKCLNGPPAKGPEAAAINTLLEIKGVCCHVVSHS